MTFKLSLFLLFEFLSFSSAVNTGANSKESWGPYVTILRSVKKCPKPSVPYSKNPAAVLYVEAKNNIVRGNYTFVKETSSKVLFQDFYYEDGKLVPTFTLKNLSCRNSLLAALAGLINVSFNKKSCAVPEGAYVFEIDYNMLDHAVMPVSRQYGRMLRRVAVWGASGTFTCIELDADVQPKK